jgi:hypothetical protein
MERFISLHLQDDSDRATSANLPNPEVKEPEVSTKKLNMIANKVAHKAASEYNRGSGGGIFSK